MVHSHHAIWRQVWAWGSNVHGQLGVGVDGDGAAQRVKPSLIPVPGAIGWENQGDNPGRIVENLGKTWEQPGKLVEKLGNTWRESWENRRTKWEKHGETLGKIVGNMEKAWTIIGKIMGT